MCLVIVSVNVHMYVDICIYAIVCTLCIIVKIVRLKFEFRLVYHSDTKIDLEKALVKPQRK